MNDWQEVLEERLKLVGFARLRDAVESLSLAYREGKSTKTLHLDPELAATAYLATRFPATYAATKNAAANAAQRLAFQPETLLDLGAGCGSASLALQRQWPSLQHLTAIEHSPAMSALGRTLLPGAAWRVANLASSTQYGLHDLVVFGYSLGELGPVSQACLEKAWEATANLLLIVEPGTPAGFARVLEARTWLLSQGASIAAPCPSKEKCPAQEPDWCHFAARLSRSQLHRRLKGGTLGYEDEKFAYLAAWRGEIPPGPPRVLRHPLIEPGRITFELCQAPNRQKLVVLKRQKPEFRIARKLGWGETYDPTRIASRDAGADVEPGDAPGLNGT